MRFYLLITICWLSVTRLCAQPWDTILIRGMIEHNESHPLKLGIRFSVFQDPAPQMALVNADGTFEKRLMVKTPTRCTLTYNGVMQSVLLTQGEPVLQLRYVEHDGPQQLLTPSSPENLAYQQFQQLFQQVFPFGRTESSVASSSIAHRDALQQKMVTWQQTESELKKMYPNTLTASWLMSYSRAMTGLQAKGELDAAHLLSSWNSADSTISLMQEWRPLLEAAADQFTDSAAPRLLPWVEAVLAQTKDNIAMQRHWLNLAVDVLPKGDRESLLQAFCTYLNQHPAIAQLQPVAAEKLKVFQSILPKQPIIDLTARDTAGALIQLSEIVSRQPLTLLLFWEPDCSHCLEALPQLRDLYRQYHSQGFEIVAISSGAGTNTQQWKAVIEQQQLGWRQGISPTDRTVYARYAISNTPGMVLIDQNKQIVHRFFTLKRLPQLVQQFLAK
ncbi:MAG: TlpA disulfide reductase family protein [Chitinophagales bacterium]